MRDIEIIKKELPVDLLEFFFLTPLPGSEDHQKLVRAGVAIDPDLNKYDLNHVTTAHPRMSAEEWERAYRMAWETYYTNEHVETVLRRLVAMRGQRQQRHPADDLVQRLDPHRESAPAGTRSSAGWRCWHGRAWPPCGAAPTRRARFLWGPPRFAMRRPASPRLPQ